MKISCFLLKTHTLYILSTEENKIQTTSGAVVNWLCSKPFGFMNNQIVGFEDPTMIDFGQNLNQTFIYSTQGQSEVAQALHYSILVDLTDSCCCEFEFLFCFATRWGLERGNPQLNIINK